MLHTAKGAILVILVASDRQSVIGVIKQRIMIMIMMMALVMTMCGQLGMVGISMLIAPRTDRPLASFCRLTKPTH